MTATVLPVLLAQASAAPPASGTRLVVAALVGIALIVVLITRFKVHPFLALTIGSLVVARVAGLRRRGGHHQLPRASATPPPAWAP